MSVDGAAHCKNRDGGGGGGGVLVCVLALVCVFVM